MLPTGTVLSERYRLEELIGMGGMGMVYRARDLRLDLDVALKILNPERASDQQTLERFEKELILARQVSHPNVVRIHDLGQQKDLHYLTMDYVPGDSLKEVLQVESRLAPDRAVEIAIDLARALQVAHEHDVVHRDLKPANVLIDAQGRAHVTDFGVARSMATPSATRTGHILGTPHYLAPEQALGEVVDGRADLYALGLLLFEMLTGKLPFDSGSYNETLAQRISGRPKLEALDAHTPVWLREVIARCLARDPEERYPDAGALRHDLEQNAATRKSGLTKRLLAGASGVLALIALAGAWWLLSGDGRPPPAPSGGKQAPATLNAALHVVAVAPFADQTGRDRLAWISTGAAEMLAVRLAESPGLQVVDTLRVFRTVDDLNLGAGFLGELERSQLSTLLGTDRLIMGRVRSLGEGLLIEARLAGAGEPRHFQVQAQGPGAILDAIGRLAEELRQAMQARAAQSHERVLSESPAAMAAYAEGVSRLSHGNTLEAIESMQQAVATDPGFAAAWVRLADAYRGSGLTDKAQEAALKAATMLDEAGGRIALQARAVNAALSGEMETALDLRQKLVTRYPNDMSARVALGELLGNMGRLGEAREALEAVVAQDPNHPRAWYLLGKYAILGGDSRRAIDEYLVRALVIQNKLDNPQGRADVLNAMGIAYAQLGETSKAQQHYEQAMDIRREIGDRHGVAAALSNIAHLLLLQGKYQGAEQRLKEALRIQSSMGDREGVAYVHNELGVLKEERGRYEEALKHYRDALKVRQDLGNKRALAVSFNNVGYAYYLVGEYDNAAVYAGQALSLHESMDNQGGAMQARQTLGLVEIARGNWDEALEAALAALATSRALGYPVASAVSLGILGKVAFYQGRYDAALKSFDEAFAIVEELGDPRGMAEFSLNLARVYLAMGAVQKADKLLQEVRGYLEQGGNREQRADLLRLQGELALKQGQPEEAIERLQSALEEARKSGSVVSLLEAKVALGRAQLASNDETPFDLLQAAAKRSTDIGHAMLSIQALETLALARIQHGEIGSAQDVLQRALSLAQVRAPYAWNWRLLMLDAELQTEATAKQQAWEQAYEALARVREHVPTVYVDAFDAQARVQELNAQVSENDTK